MDSSLTKMNNFVSSKPNAFFVPLNGNEPSLAEIILSGKTVIIREIPLSEADDCEITIIGNRVFSTRRIKPVLITEDIGLLLRKWRAESGQPCPSDEYFRRFTDTHFTEIRRFFPDSVLLTTKQLSAGIDRTAKKYNRPILDWPTFRISLDGDLLPRAKMVIEITRARDIKTHRPIGVLARPGEPPFKRQIDKLRAIIPKRHTVEILVDGCWSGNEVLMVVEELRRQGLEIDKVICGILTKNGLAEMKGYDIAIYPAFPYFGLTSWICQRDFIPGVPRSGLNLATNGKLNEDIGAPYILPFREDFFTTLSTHDKQELATVSLEMTEHLFAEMERQTGRIIITADLKRRPYLIPAGRSFYRRELKRLIKARFAT